MSAEFSISVGDNHIAVLTINHPARRNAVTSAMWQALPKLLERLAANEAVRILIVRGAGEHFSAGADISEFETLYATSASSQKASEEISAGFEALARFPKPTIAMISGACVGGGCGLALCCDMRFADNTSRFAITPAKLGLVYPFGDVQRLIEIVGMAYAKDMLLSARAFSAKRAEKMGLINRRFKPDELESEVWAVAEHMTRLSPQSLAIMKKMFAAYQAGQFGDNAQSAEWFLDGFNSDDFKKGYRAFLEKRRPEF